MASPSLITLECAGCGGVERYASEEEALSDGWREIEEGVWADTWGCGQEYYELQHLAHED